MCQCRAGGRFAAKLLTSLVIRSRDQRVLLRTPIGLVLPLSFFREIRAGGLLFHLASAFLIGREFACMQPATVLRIDLHQPCPARPATRLSQSPLYSESDRSAARCRKASLCANSGCEQSQQKKSRFASDCVLRHSAYVSLLFISGVLDSRSRPRPERWQAQDVVGCL